MVSSMFTDEEEACLLHIKNLLNQFNNDDNIHCKLNIIKQTFNTLLLVPTIIEKHEGLQNILRVKILEFRENETAKADVEFINVSNIIIGIIDDINGNIRVNDYEEDDYYMMYQCERF